MFVQLMSDCFEIELGFESIGFEIPSVILQNQTINSTYIYGIEFENNWEKKYAEKSNSEIDLGIRLNLGIIIAENA